MTQSRLWARFPSGGVSFLALTLGISAVLPAGAQTETSAGTADPFVLDQYYIGAEGGAVVALADFFANPLQFLRSDAAYTALRAHFASVLEVESLSSADFQALHTDGRIRLKPCAEVGSFRTDGITPAGVVVQSPRTACYRDEYFIEVQTPAGDWIVVASQGCMNPIRLVRTNPPPEQPHCVRVPMDVNVNDGGFHMHADGTWHPNCCCGVAGHYTPSYHFDMGSTQHADGFVLQCR